MKKVLFFLLACFLFALIPSTGISEDRTVTLRLDRKQATIADSIRMVVSISGSRDRGLEPVLHGLEDFRVERGGTSSRVEIINGRVNSRVEYIYFIEPKKIGTFEIGPVECKIDGKVYRSDTETITVVKSAAASSGHNRGDVFLTGSLSSKTVYVGQQVFYTLKLYHRIKVSDISLTLPEIEYLSFKQLGDPIEYNEFYDGQSYDVLEVRYVLIPSARGTYDILPSKMTMIGYQPGRRSPDFFGPFFSDPFASQGSRMAVESDALELRVIPLPGAGRPSDFSGLVGNFKIESRLEPARIKEGESTTLTVSVSGRGNMNRIPDLKLPELNNLKIYADEPVLNVKVDSKGFSGSKTMKWAIVPEKEGLYNIPALSISFFDPEKKRYRTIKSHPGTIHAIPGKKERVVAQNNGNSKTISKEKGRHAVKEIGHDILPVHSSVYYLREGRPMRIRGTILFALLSGPALIYFMVFWIIMLRNSARRSAPATRARKAARELIRRCRHGSLTPNELIIFIRDYLNDRFGLSLGYFTSQEAARILSSRGVTADTVREVKNFIGRIEDAVYTGRGGKPFEAKDELPGFIRKIEKEIR